MHEDQDVARTFVDGDTPSVHTRSHRDLRTPGCTSVIASSNDVVFRSPRCDDCSLQGDHDVWESFVFENALQVHFWLAEEGVYVAFKSAGIHGTFLSV